MKSIPTSGQIPAPASSEHLQSGSQAHTLPLRPVARRQRSLSVDESSPLARGLRRQISDLNDQVALAERALDDTATRHGRLSDGLRQHMRAQWQHEHQLNSESFYAGSYASLRRRQLARLPGGVIASVQFGLSFADEMTSREPRFSRLRMVHGASGSYQRIAPGPDSRLICDDLYQRRYPDDRAPRLFANSMFMANKLRNTLLDGPGAEECGVINCRQVGPGIVALRCENPEDAEALDKILIKLGGRPSAYQVMRCLVQANGDDASMVHDPRVSVQHALADLQGTARRGAAAQLRNIPTSLGTAALAHTAAVMIDDLCHVLKREDIRAVHDHNPLVARSLDALTDLAEAMPAMSHDSVRFGNAYRAMMEEMHVILSAVRPWQAVDFKRAAMGRLDQAIPPALKAKLTLPEPCLTTSGMQALIFAFDQARECANYGEVKPLSHGDKVSPFYYEANDMLSQISLSEEDRRGTDTVFYASLTDSVISPPGHRSAGWGVDDIAAGIKAQLAQRETGSEPLNVVIDITLENGDDLKRLMAQAGPDIASNRLRLFLCKSHQKFANLAAAKATGGSITLLSAGNPANNRILTKMQDDEYDQGWHLNDETQLLTHITRAAQQREPVLLQNAVDNGNFVVEHCFNGRDGHARFAAHDSNKPFAMVNLYEDSDNQRWSGLRFAHGNSPVEMRVQPDLQLDRDFIRHRGSFGFAETTLSMIGTLPGFDNDVMRLSFGQETKPELIERFWMASRLMSLDQPTFDCHQATALVNKLVAEALSPQQQRTLRQQPLAEKLKVISRQEGGAISDEQRRHADVSELRAAQATPQKFTLNKIASVVGQIATLLELRKMHGQMAESPDREMLSGLVNALLDVRMAGISRLGREQIVRMQNKLSREDMFSQQPETRRAGVESLLNALEKSGISSALGIFDYGIPDQAWQELSEGHKNRLMNAIFRPLDTQAKLEYLRLNFGGKSSHLFLAECAGELATQLRGESHGNSRENWQATLTQEMLSRNMIAPTQRPFPPVSEE